MTTVKLLDFNIFLSDNVLEVFENYIQDTRAKNESGGILLGQIKGKNVYILKATIPTKFDKSTRTTFHRSKDIAQIIVDYEFKNSNGRTIYLGEWHTHPENNPTPSNQDAKMIDEQIKLGKLNENFVLLVIQGINNLYVGIYKKNILLGGVI